MELRELIIRRDGVLTIAEALAVGMSRSAVARRTASGQWRTITRGVYLVADHLRSDRAQARIAVHSVGPTAVLGGAGAAWWLGIHDTPPRTHTVFTDRHGRLDRASATARPRFRTLAPADVATVDGLRTTTAALTVLDAAGELGIGILDTALLRGTVSMADLHAAHARYPKRHGAPTITGFLRLVADGSRSAAERSIVALVRAAGISGWHANHPVAGYLVDLAFPAAMLAVEIDGFAFHRDLSAFQHDRTRRNALTAAGWTVLNFTWGDLIERPTVVIGQIRAGLRRSA